MPFCHFHVKVYDRVIVYLLTDEAVKLDEAAALPPTAAATETDAAIAAAMAATVNGVDLEIDEELFGGDDIDDVEDELENLDLVDE